MPPEPAGACARGATPFLGPEAGSLCFQHIFLVAGVCAGAYRMSQCRSLRVSMAANSWGLVCMGVVLGGCASLGHSGDPGVGCGCAWVCRGVSLPYLLSVGLGCVGRVVCVLGSVHSVCMGSWAHLSRKVWQLRSVRGIVYTCACVSRWWPRSVLCVSLVYVCGSLLGEPPSLWCVWVFTVFVEGSWICGFFGDPAMGCPSVLALPC